VIAMKEVKSSAIAAHGYDAAQRVLAVRLTSGKVYHYGDVPPETAQAFAGAESLGRAYGSMIRGHFDVVDAPEVG
jgi:hypothetical protein